MTHEYKPGPATLRGGYGARIYETDGAEPMVIHGAYLVGDVWHSMTWTKAGAFMDGPRAASCLDLVPPRRQVWVALALDGDELQTWHFDTEAHADTWAGAFGRRRIDVFSSSYVETEA